MRSVGVSGPSAGGLLGGFLFLFWVLVGSAYPQDGANVPSYGPVPDWVDTISFPEPGEEYPDGISQGLYYLLLENQDRLDVGRVEYYRHGAWLITDRAGLEEASRLSFDFDPANESLVIHSVRVWRDGIPHDRLESETFTTIRRETGLQSGVVDGRLTAFVELSDVRVGDIVEYQLTRINESLTWPGGYGKRINLEWTVPLARHHYRIVARDNADLTIRAHNTEVEPIVSSSAGWTERIWRRDNIPFYVEEFGQPADHDQGAYLSVSNLQSWSDVVDWALPIYESGANLPESGLERVRQIQSEFSSDQDQITAAIQYVQDEFRYVADGIGIGGYVPRSPSRVLELGYGDCKDKSLLLVTILRELGYEASVALTDIDRGLGFERIAPSPHAFDHMITQITYAGQEYWVDATSSYRGGVFPDIATPTYEYALPVREGQVNLVAMEVDEQSEPSMETLEVFDMGNLETEGVTITVTTIYRNHEADNFRVGLANNSLLQYSRNYLDYYKNIYPGVEMVSELQVEDDRQENQITTIELYKISTAEFYAEDRQQLFTLRADAVLNQIESVNASSRSTPVGLAHPLSRKHTFQIINYPTMLFGITDVVMVERFASFKTRSTSRNAFLEITYSFDSNSSRGAPEDVIAFNQMADEIWDSGNLTIDLSSTPAQYSTLLNWIENPENEAALGWIIILVFYLIMIPGAFISLSADKKIPEGAVFYPVNLSKFFLMSIFTLNLYQVLWMWKSWRWLKRSEDRNLSPFGRSFFGIFYFWGLFNEIKNKAGPGKGLPAFLGVTLAVVYLVWGVSARFFESYTEHSTELAFYWSGLAVVFSLASTVWMLPTVAMVNGMNKANPEVQSYTSRMTLGSWIAIFAGALLLGLVALGSFQA